MSRHVLFALVLLPLVAGCPGPSGTDDAGDAGEILDAPADGDSGPPPPDAPPPDSPRLDVGRDAPDVRVDAGPDVTAEVDAALDVICGVPAYANCTAPWTCGCETFGGPMPDLASCLMRERSFCEFEQRPALTAFFQRAGITLDRDALAACIAAARRSFDLCLPQPVLDPDVPAACYDAFVLGTALGGRCDFSGMRCADGAGVCAGRTCAAAPDTAGATCIGTCAAGLSCVRGTCQDPVALDGACTDHEDCAGPELCVGGTCAPPVASGGACTIADRCTTGLRCEAGSCAPRVGSRCMLGAPGQCGSGEECRSSSVRVCRARLGTGSPCNGEEECSLTLTCDFSSGFPGVCSRLPRAGEMCTSRCESGLICVGDRFGGSTCQPQRRLGEVCDVFTRDGSVCESGLSCNMGVCGPLPRLDERCSDDGLCEAGLACLFDDFTFEQFCRPALPEGGDCSRVGGGCADGLFCDFSTFPAICRAVPREGEECPSGNCATGLECRFFDALMRSICVLPAALGEECQSLCDGEAFCAPDPTAGACTALVCDYVTSGGIIEPPVPFDAAR